jgi:hypothetical protein
MTKINFSVSLLFFLFQREAWREEELVKINNVSISMGSFANIQAVLEER